MQKILYTSFVFFIFCFSLFSEVTITNYGNWQVKTIHYEHNNNKTVTISTVIDKKVEVYIASRQNQFNITFSWYDTKIKDENAKLEYRFDNKDTYIVEPIVRSIKQNFDILYTISPSFGILQEDEVINFFNNLVTSKMLYIKQDNFSYNINLNGLREAILNTDFSNTLFDKYKNKIK